MPSHAPPSGSPEAIRRALDAGPVSMPGVYDALTARLAARAGHEVLFVSGFAVAAARLGMPDVGYLTLDDMAEATRLIAATTDRPLIVDADTGYGNALSARHAAQTLARAGAAGVFLEDQEWPKRCGHLAGKRVVDRPEWLAKLRAILDWRGESGRDLFVVARTDARAALSLTEAIDRALAARDLGVDAVFVEAPESLAELERVGKEVPDVTLVANMVEGGRTPLLDQAELAALGYSLTVTPLAGLLAAADALERAYGLLRRRGTLRAGEVRLMDFERITEVTGLDDHRALERRYTTR